MSSPKCPGLILVCSKNVVTGQLWSLSTTTIQVRLRIQLNSILYAKTLVRKDVASNAPPPPPTTAQQAQNDADAAAAAAGPTPATEVEKSDEDDFSSKAQIMTLMTTDVDRVSDFAWHVFSLVGTFDKYISHHFDLMFQSQMPRLKSSSELYSCTAYLVLYLFLYRRVSRGADRLSGVSCFFGLAVTCLFLPMNHYASKVVVGAQENLMKARDERVSLMNEVSLICMCSIQLN